MQTDFLIIGQGLAGSLLAWELLQRDCNVVIVDNGLENASLVAAGIINPITGIRLVKTTDIETLLPSALDCYAQLSTFFRTSFYYEQPMLRIFRNENELDYAKKRLQQADYLLYLGELSKPASSINDVSTPLGFITQKQTGHLAAEHLLTQLKQFFIECSCYRQAVIDYKSIHFGNTVQWQDISAKQIIFCEGYHGSQNPWFSWLPFQPAKGEILTLSYNLPLANVILNNGNWSIPYGNNEIRIGATFEREYSDIFPSEQGKATLINNVTPLLPCLNQAKLINHQAGIRPCSADKYPFIGKHPQHDKLAVFNGFGTKGSLQIPWYSQRFAGYLLNQNPLPASCDIQRFQTHYPAG